jgi:putative glutamine amidotransferase
VQEARPDRDAFELALAAVTRQWDTPVLGICSGMQVMAVAAGGTLVQHLREVVGHEEHSSAPGVYGSHCVRTVERTRVSALLGQQVVIPSYHHQSMSSHPGYVPAAWAPDGTLEAMEHLESRFRWRCSGILRRVRMTDCSMRSSRLAQGRVSDHSARRVARWWTSVPRC